MGKHLHSAKLSETLTLSLCTDGFWLYDKTLGMNLSMKASTSESAFVEALTYYQNRLVEVESKYKSLQSKVDAFVSQLVEEDEE
jgi:hypothetical protein